MTLCTSVRRDSGEMVPKDKPTLVDLDKELPSPRETRSTQTAKPDKTVSSSRRSFLTKAATATTLSVTSLMGTAALLTNSDDAAAATDAFLNIQGIAEQHTLGGRRSIDCHLFVKFG